MGSGVRRRVALLTGLCLGILSVSGPVASAAARPALDASVTPSSPPVTATPTASCDTSDLAMSTPSSAEITTVYSPGTRAIDPVILRNNSSVDCPDSGIIVLLLPSPVDEPEPALQWRIDGGAWQGTSLSWDNGVVNGNASCASPCWKAAIFTLDVPPHTTYTIDLAVIFHTGLNYGAFDGGVYYTAHAVIPDGVSGPSVAWDYYNQAGGAGAGGGSGGGGGAPGSGASPVVGSRTAGPSRSTAASLGASVSPSASAVTATPTVSSWSASPVASQGLAALADAHAGGSGTSMPTVIALVAAAVLALAVGAGFVLARRRRGNPPQPPV